MEEKEKYLFVIYMLHEISRKWNMIPSKIYDILDRSGCISDYLVRHYEVLHTMGTSSVVHDVEVYLRERNIQFE